MTCSILAKLKGRLLLSSKKNPEIAKKLAESIESICYNPLQGNMRKLKNSLKFGYSRITSKKNYLLRVQVNHEKGMKCQPLRANLKKKYGETN